jgi:hypothetical protein
VALQLGHDWRHSPDRRPRGAIRRCPRSPGKATDRPQITSGSIQPPQWPERMRRSVPNPAGTELQGARVQLGQGPLPATMAPKPFTCPLDPQRQDLELPHRWDTRQEDHYFAALNGMLFPFKLETPPQSLEEDSDICSNVLRATSDKDRACAQENLLVSQGAAIRREY